MHALSVKKQCSRCEKLVCKGLHIFTDSCVGVDHFRRLSYTQGFSLISYSYFKLPAIRKMRNTYAAKSFFLHRVAKFPPANSDILIHLSKAYSRTNDEIKIGDGG